MAFLFNQRADITKRWAEVAERYPELAASDLSDGALADHLPEFFGGLAAALHGRPATNEAAGKAKLNGQAEPVVERQETTSILPAGETKYRTLFESIDEGVCLLELLRDSAGRVTDFRYVEVNLAFTNQTGLREVIGRTGREVIPGVEEEWFEIFDQVARTGQAARFVQGAENLGRWFDVHAFALEVDGKTHVALLFTEITQRHRTERALLSAKADVQQVSEQRRLALDSARLGWWHFDLVVGSVYWDERFKEIFGVKDGELVYEKILSLLHPDDQEKVDAAIKAAVCPDDPVPYTIEYRVVRDDGSLRWVQAHGKAHFLGEGDARRAVSIVGTVMDISQAKAAQEALRMNEEKYRSLFTSIDTGFCVIEIVWDDQGNATDYRFLEMNPAFVAHSGLQGAVGKTIREMFPGFEQVFIDRYARVARTGEAVRFEEGSEALGRWFEVYAFALRQGNQDQVAVLFSDNSERRRTELALQAAKNEAERNSQMKDEFLATLSHELRTPLNAVLGWTQVLRGDPANSEDMEAGLATIERNARAQNQIIEDLLDMSKIVAGKVRLDVQPLELDQVVKSAVETMRPAADAKGIRLQALIDPEARMISGDPNRLQQVFWNLLTNALKFTPKGGRVQVVLERVNSHLEVSVNDSGEGIAPEFIPYVFDRFRQQDASTTRVHGGLGLGLAIVKQLVELHGGSVGVESAGRGMGTTFRVLLPLWVVRPETDEVHGERVHPAASKGTPLVLPANGLSLEGVRALVVDDEVDARGLVKRILEDRGAHVQAAASVPEALEFLSAQPVDVLVSDVGMPGQDGYDLIRQVRALPPEQGGNTPAVALTAYARSEDRLKVILAGFQMHMAKPVEAAELLAQVASLTGRVNRP